MKHMQCAILPCIATLLAACLFASPAKAEEYDDAYFVGGYGDYGDDDYDYNYDYNEGVDYDEDEDDYGYGDNDYDDNDYDDYDSDDYGVDDDDYDVDDDDYDEDEDYDYDEDDEDYYGYDGIPWSLQAFVQKYPQAISLVNNYYDYRDFEGYIDITDELYSRRIPLFFQWDCRWAYRSYGGDFLGVTSCGPTSLSMVICGLTGSDYWNPYEVATWAQDNGYFIPGEGTAWALMEEGCSYFGLVSEDLGADSYAVREALLEGRPVICSMVPGDFTYYGHFIVLTYIDEDGLVYMNDSNSPANSYSAFDLDYVLGQAAGAWAYSLA